ncbi:MULTISPECIES: hypothetical protein [Cyanophyceae]|uniref:hypothetical protein n=1 Tax=Cyanophyceae TaxID=3028117 RepID=UPI001684C7E5|nr:hypothetical protein [Trichocoleus sp. FACHB-40]MBD2001702.1 hypothetical protein [Trichocoleus sp. FACHB-40]
MTSVRNQKLEIRTQLYWEPEINSSPCQPEQFPTLTMKKDFNDPKTLIDDCTPVPEETLDWVTALQGKQITVRELEFGEDIHKLLKPPHFDAIQFLNSRMRVEENRITIETSVREHFSCPESARKAFASINQLRDLAIRYRKVNGVDRLWCKRGNSDSKNSDRASANKNVDRVGCKEKNSNGNPKDREEENYITAAKYLPDLLRKNGDILVKPDQQERFAKFKKAYRTQALWIEYYLLESSGIVTDSGFKPPTERQYRPGKISAKLHELIQDMWAEAKINQNSLCKWILAFDCPSQAWLTLEAILLLNQWNEQPPKNGLQLYQAEQATLKQLREPEGIKASLRYSDNEDENFLFLDEAFSVTLIQLLKSRVGLAQCQDYLKVRTAQANGARKGEKGKRSNKGFGKSK